MLFGIILGLFLAGKFARWMDWDGIDYVCDVALIGFSLGLLAIFCFRLIGG